MENWSWTVYSMVIGGDVHKVIFVCNLILYFFFFDKKLQ